MAEAIDYAAVLADLEAKRAAIDNMIANVRQMLNLGAEQGAALSGAKKTTAEVEVDSFFGMSIPDAIIKFLGMMTQPQSVSDITRALQNGGLKSNAKNVALSVSSTLSRIKKAGQVVLIQGKWGLQSRYPASRREPAQTPKAKTGKPIAALTPEQVRQIRKSECGRQVTA